MKKIIIGVVIGLGLGMAGSALALPSMAPFVTMPAMPVNNLSVDVSTDTPSVKVSISQAEQVAEGYTYDIYTGAKLPLSATEIRFRKLEARVSALEAKQK